LLSGPKFATPIEQKDLLKEHVTEIRVARNGPALLEANPAGLLRCIEMVTPRGVPRKETDVLPFPDEHRPAVRLAGV
jgi:hypothetical protein